MPNSCRRCAWAFGEGFPDLISPPAAAAPRKNVPPWQTPTAAESSHRRTASLPLEWEKHQASASAPNPAPALVPEAQAFPGTAQEPQNQVQEFDFSNKNH